MNTDAMRHGQRMRQAVITRRGHSPRELRQAVEAWVALISGRRGDALPELPPELHGYIEKVARHAYRIVDADIDALKRAGYSEDAVFEVTVAAAVGAGVGRLERAMWALQESPQPKGSDAVEAAMQAERT